MPTFRIFYSWQSDLPGNKTRSFIRDCIDDAIAFAGESEAIEAVRDEATKDTTGSPNIVTTLFSKIDDCDLFVADVSLCFSGDVKKEKDGNIDDDLDKKEYEPRQTLEEEIEGKMFIADYEKCLSVLDQEEQFVLKNWFDEEFKHSYSAKEIADELNIESKKVEKIKDKALQKIRNNPIMQKYQDFIA